MKQFDNRKKGEETKFSLDGTLRFKATARRNKLLGLWAAERLGLSGAEAEAYAKSVVEADFERPGDDDVMEKVLNDLQRQSPDVTEHQIRKRMEELMTQAQAQIAEENANG